MDAIFFSIFEKFEKFAKIGAVVPLAWITLRVHNAADAMGDVKGMISGGSFFLRKKRLARIFHNGTPIIHNAIIKIFLAACRSRCRR